MLFKSLLFCLCQDFTQISSQEFVQEAALLGGLSVTQIRDIPAQTMAQNAWVNPKAADESAVVCDKVRTSVSWFSDVAYHRNYRSICIWPYMCELVLL